MEERLGFAGLWIAFGRFLNTLQNEAKGLNYLAVFEIALQMNQGLSMSITCGPRELRPSEQEGHTDLGGHHRHWAT